MAPIVADLSTFAPGTLTLRYSSRGKRSFFNPFIAGAKLQRKLTPVIFSYAMFMQMKFLIFAFYHYQERTITLKIDEKNISPPPPSVGRSEIRRRCRYHIFCCFYCMDRGKGSKLKVKSIPEEAEEQCLKEQVLPLATSYSPLPPSQRRESPRPRNQKNENA
uniref:Uncharacterized protein n=1 Tax=Romanomermis culicivorax TaxID=13658 RepID=A0A915JTH1_ROMCU